MTTTNEAITTHAVSADAPQPEPTLPTPEAVVDALRAVRALIGNVTPLTPAQRKTLRDQMRASNPVVQASINVIGALDNVAQAVGQPASEVRQMDDESNRWTAVEDELRALLNGVSGANLIRRHRVARVAAQAAGIGSQLARNPANAMLVPHLQEIKRLKSFARRKKPAPATDTPQSSAPVEPTPHGAGEHQQVIRSKLMGGRETGRVQARPVNLEIGRYAHVFGTLDVR